MTKLQGIDEFGAAGQSEQLNDLFRPKRGVTR